MASFQWSTDSIFFRLIQLCNRPLWKIIMVHYRKKQLFKFSCFWWMDVMFHQLPAHILAVIIISSMNDSFYKDKTFIILFIGSLACIICKIILKNVYKCNSWETYDDLNETMINKNMQDMAKSKTGPNWNGTNSNVANTEYKPPQNAQPLIVTQQQMMQQGNNQFVMVQLPNGQMTYAQVMTTMDQNNVNMNSGNNQTQVHYDNSQHASNLSFVSVPHYNYQQDISNDKIDEEQPSAPSYNEHEFVPASLGVEGQASSAFTEK